MRPDEKDPRGERPELLEDELLLRARLAIDRTSMANERTFLAYIRTALAIMLTGAGVMSYFRTGAAFWGGLLFIALGGFAAVTGLRHFLSMKGKITSAEKEAGLCKES